MEYGIVTTLVGCIHVEVGNKSKAIVAIGTNMYKDNIFCKRTMLTH